MRVLQLPPARRPTTIDWIEKTAPADGDPGSQPAEVIHQYLADPASTDFARRHLFNPKDGWFRRTERGLNKFLSRRIFPHLPFITRPYAAILERFLTVSEANLHLGGLGGHEPLKVLVISDIHGGPFVTSDVLESAFLRLLTLKPDLILLPGDFATVSVSEVEGIVAALRCLQAPFGVFGVLGNHDHYTNDTETLSSLLESAGIELLQNRSVIIEKGDTRFILGGVDDLLQGQPDFHSALSGYRSGLPTVIMSHNPDVFPEAVKHGVSLVLAGHTHGGQIRIPGLSVLVRMSRYRLDEGRYEVDGSELIVSRGLGATGLPLRVSCPPEALLVNLVPDETA